MSCAELGLQSVEKLSDRYRGTGKGGSGNSIGKEN